MSLLLEALEVPLVPAPEFWEGIEEVASGALPGRALRRLLSILETGDVRETPRNVEIQPERRVRRPAEWVWAGAAAVGGTLKDLFEWEWRRRLRDPREVLCLVAVRRLALEALHGFLQDPGLEWALDAAILGAKLLVRDRGLSGCYLDVPEWLPERVEHVPGRAADALRTLGVGLFRLEVGACALALRAEKLKEDAHELVEGGKPLKLGGVEINFPKGIVAHSDGDVLLHALIDAILGALALPDIGELFPDTDPQYKDADSTELLRRVVKIMHESGYTVENMDCVVICDEPKISPYKEKIISKLSEILHIRQGQISVKGKTREGLCKGENSIIVLCTVLLRKTKSY
ncbi:MAG: 2-C-methyl-D-erythritol 2,4-cyclodiphosphate synthase [Euryarchaeota archaeon]